MGLYQSVEGFQSKQISWSRPCVISWKTEVWLECRDHPLFSRYHTCQSFSPSPSVLSAPFLRRTLTGSFFTQERVKAQRKGQCLSGVNCTWEQQAGSVICWLQVRKVRPGKVMLLKPQRAGVRFPTQSACALSPTSSQATQGAHYRLSLSRSSLWV